MTGRVVLLAVVLGATGAVKPLSDLPTDLAYYSWHELSNATIQLDEKERTFLWVLCRPRTPEEEERLRPSAKSEHAPHVGWVRVYVNDLALGALRSGARPFPVGSRIAKEKRVKINGEPDGVGFMVKRSKDERPESDGWEFDYYPKSPGASLQSCVDCHRTGNSLDYVFTRRSKLVFEGTPTLR